VSQSRYAASNLANYRGADLYLSVHTNAISGDCYSNCGTGIEAFWSSNNSSSGSQRIAQLCVDNCISMVRNYYDSSFACRWGCKAQDKNYAETRRATMPSVLFEFGFHDNCAKDAKYLGDNFFRTVGMYGLAKAVYDYYGITPKWGPFSAEYISDTIPATVRPGETKQVSITFKNHGLCWQTAEGFKLVDVNSGATKALPGEIMPGETCTFTFNMTFPSTAGTHTVKWRMRRDEDGVGLFGDTLTKNVKVINPEKDSQCTANNIPASIKVGETRNVTLTFKNTGTKPWIKADGFRLGWGSDESDPFTTTGRVQLPGDIAPGQSVTFTIPMTFNKVGTFTTDWQMLHENVEWFGDVASTTVNVHPPMDNAQIISSTIPSSVRVGETRNVTFTIKNTGDTTWTWASGYHLCFGSDGTDPFCSSWGELGQEVSVAPGQTTEITVAMNFTKMGTFTTDWQMIHGDSRFGNTHSKSVTVTTDKVNGAEIISSTIPSTATLGETRNVTFTVKNTGTTTWSWDGGYHLCFGADQSDPFATRWGELGNGVMLAPGQTATITVSMTFGQAGTFTTDWQMTQDGVGRFGNVHSKSVTVSAPSATDNAEITGHTIPSTATVGETKDVTFTIKNTGTSSWTWAEDYHLCFGNDGTDPFCSSWGDFGQEVTVAPGQTATITVRMTFDKAGTFTSDWQMIHGGTRFGNSVSKSVTVTAPSGNNAEILSNTIPSSVNVGETRNVTFTVKNTGTTTWSWEAGYHLYFGEDAYDPFASAWGELGDGVTVAPGATATITVPMTFSSPGTYTTDWQMIQDGKGRFGNTVSKSVTVNGGVGTYYVDANSGNDSNNGLSPSTAWKTLKKASDNAANGGTNLASGSYVIVKGGTYTANERG
ncbi:MAG: N-acetylmuramoyl-L-alanine amidase, partial [Abditibacteriota bacterium]|nr:N-acetylmuramoyl-L-alanine amidase [Abditibacteriota bacterium]